MAAGQSLFVDFGVSVSQKSLKLIILLKIWRANPTSIFAAARLTQPRLADTVIALSRQWIRGMYDDRIGGRAGRSPGPYRRS